MGETISTGISQKCKECDVPIGTLSFSFGGETLCPTCSFKRISETGRIAGLKEAGTIAAEKACALSEQGEDEESSGASEVWQAIQARISALEDDHE